VAPKKKGGEHLTVVRKNMLILKCNGKEQHAKD